MKIEQMTTTQPKLVLSRRKIYYEISRGVTEIDYGFGIIKNGPPEAKVSPKI